MKKTAQIKHSIRFPPFGTDSWIPSKLPICKETLETDRDVPGSFLIGDKDGWFVERTVLGGNNTVYTGDFPKVVSQQRQGWYMLPDPIHQTARKIIRYSVLILLFTLGYLALTPVLEILNITTFGTKSLRFGFLDYPILIVIVAPMMLLPIVIRVTANLKDLRRQKFFLTNAPKSPRLDLESADSQSSLCGKLTFPEIRSDWERITISWRVGILSPSREAMFKSQNRSENGQPPPGLSTPMPHNWSRGLDDGTGYGEDIPMERNDLPGGVFLRPMRVMALGGQCDFVENETFQLDPPLKEWPGSTYSDLVRVHWEVIIKIRRKQGGPLLWAQPVHVRQKSDFVHVEKPVYVDGRSEIVQYIPH